MSKLSLEEIEQALLRGDTVDMAPDGTVLRIRPCTQEEVEARDVRPQPDEKANCPLCSAPCKKTGPIEPIHLLGRPPTLDELEGAIAVADALNGAML